jgi:hypothetical protein
MTSLIIVEYDLKKHSDVDIVGKLDKILLPGEENGFSQYVDYFVAPKKPIYNLDELNTFMSGLIYCLKPTAYENRPFFSDHDGLNCGMLVFEETMKYEMPDILEKLKAETGTAPVLDPNKDYRRLIEVKVFPNHNIAEEFYSGRIYSNGSCQICYHDLMPFVPFYEHARLYKPNGSGSTPSAN